MVSSVLNTRMSCNAMVLCDARSGCGGMPLLRLERRRCEGAYARIAVGRISKLLRFISHPDRWFLYK